MTKEAALQQLIEKFELEKDEYKVTEKGFIMSTEKIPAVLAKVFLTFAEEWHATLTFFPRGKVIDIYFHF